MSLNLEVVEELGLAVRQQEPLFSYRRAEIGGLLLGAVERSRGAIAVRVEGFEPVNCEHAFGASYLLSGDDQRGLARRLRRHNAASGAIIGFFRSNTRKEFALTPEDIDLMARYFAKPSMVLLMVQVTSGGKLRGAFWDQPAMRTVNPPSEFPFDAVALLAETGDARRLRASTATVEPARAIEVRLPKRDALAARVPALRSHRPPASLGSVRSSAAQAYAHAGRLLAQAQSQWLPSSLLARRWRVEWLAAALVVALLAGMRHQGGRESAAPVADIQQLMRATESTRRPAPRLPPIEIGAAPAPAEPRQSDAPAILAGGDSAARSAPAAGKARQKGRTRARTVTISLGPQLAGVASAVPLPDAPNIATAPPAEPPVAWSGIPAFPAYDVPDPFVRIAVQPIPYSHRGLMNRLLSRKSAAAAFDPPRVLQELPPEIPSELRKQVRDTVPVTVKLHLDRAGRVDSAELVSHGSGRSKNLAALAVFACRKWQFSPAHLGGETVPAEVLVRFQFGGAAEAMRRGSGDER